MDDMMQYRNAVVPNFVEEAENPIKDEQDYRTLKKVQKALDNSLFNLGKDFNAFNVLNRPDTEQLAKDLLVDIRAFQIAHSIISNLKAQVDSAIDRVDSLNKRKK